MTRTRADVVNWANVVELERLQWIERIARGILERSTVNSTRWFKIQTVIRDVMGPGSVCGIKAGVLPSEGVITKISGKWRIFIEEGLPPERLRFVLAHELGHWALEVNSSNAENEYACDTFAAMLCMPDAALHRAIAVAGRSPCRLGSRFVVPPSEVHLRMNVARRLEAAA